jgi:hypothetical protein
LRVIRRTLDDAPAAFVANQSCATKNVQVIGQSGTGKACRFTQFPYGQADLARLNQ